MNVPKYLYDQFPEQTEIFNKIEIYLKVLEGEKKLELFPKINEGVVLTKLVYRFLIYIQITLWRICDISKAILKSWEDKNISSSFILLRALYENVSVLFEALIRLEELITNKDFKGIHKLIFNLTYCTRLKSKIDDAVKMELQRNEKGIGDFKDEKEIREVYKAVQILDVMDAIVGFEPEHRNDYEQLCEYTHPNSEGMIGLYGKWKDEFTLELSNDNGITEINVKNFFSRFFTCIDMFTFAHDGILQYFNDITKIAVEDLKGKGRDDEIYTLPIKS